MQLKNILTRKQARAGLRLIEDEDVEDIVCLEYKGRILATWFALEVKPAQIQEKAQILLSKLQHY
jgi:hypothetical protein